MLSKALTERELIQICMVELCRKVGFAGVDGLVQRDLQFLCDGVEGATGVLISLSTMRRLVNGEFARMPQVATLDAIAGFAGYSNWQGFRVAKNGGMPGGELRTEEGNGEMVTRQGGENGGVVGGRRVRMRLGRRGRFVVLGVGLVVVAVGLLAIVLRKPGLGPVGAAEFSAVKVTHNELPNTVVFHYNIDDINADSFFIQQSWDKNRRVRIYKHSHTLTDIYYEPGYHVAKLFANDQIIKTVDVSIPTDRWFFYAKEGGFYGKAHYISATAPLGPLQLRAEDIAGSGIDMHKENCYVAAYFPSHIEYSSDDFTFSFKIRMHSFNNVFCPYFMGEVYCQRRFMYFQNTSRGCTSNIKAQFGENLLDGKTNDLSAMGLDITAWQDVQLRVQQRHVSVWVNGSEVLNTVYQQSCGMITGLGFLSNGLCEVDSVDLKTGDGRVVCGNAEILHPIR